MANRGMGYGISAQVANKVSKLTISYAITRLTNCQIASKRDGDLEGEVLAWIEAVLGEAVPAGNYEDVLKDGVILCK